MPCENITKLKNFVVNLNIMRNMTKEMEKLELEFAFVHIKINILPHFIIDFTMKKMEKI